ncbi:MAG: SseB family protein [Micrococcales bacterium]
MSHSHEHINPDRFADSAGTPWAGREFDENPWSNDDGSADPKFIETLAAFRTGAATNEQVVDVIRKMRLLIPLLADLGEGGEGAHGQTVDKSADLSIVTVATPDDQNGLPVFSSVAAMQAWNPTARPVPADARRVALAAASEGNTRIIVDAQSETEFAIRRPAIEAIATAQSWVHPVRDERVHAEFASLIENFEKITAFALEDCDETSRLRTAEVQLVLTLEPGLEVEKVQALMQEFAQALSQSSIIAEHVDSLRVKLA